MSIDLGKIPLPWKKDDKLYDDAAYLVVSKRRYENYVLCMFGEKLANANGIEIVFRSPNDYPDAILVDMENQRSFNVEFEEYSADFKGHDPSKCDLIICYIHNWKDRYPNEKCPLPVYALGEDETLGGKFYSSE